MTRHRVVVTGYGVIAPIGLTVDQFWSNLLAGVSGVGPLLRFDPSNLPVRIAAQVEGFDPADYLNPKAARRMSRFVQFSVAASKQALQHSGLEVTEENKYDVGAIVATGGGGVEEVYDETQVLLERGPDRVNPLFVPAMIANMASCQVSITFGLHGPAVTNIAACAAGVYAFYEAVQFIRRGDASALLTGGTESAIIPLSFTSLAKLGALSRRNDDPRHASRPFDRDRDGFVFGEGAAILMLESLEHAQARGAHILAEVAGASTTSDAYHLTAPEPSGESAARAMSHAIKDAGLTTREIDYVCAHGTGTPLNDVSETRAIKKVFGAQAYDLAISSPKSMIGHLLGAAGAMSALTCVKALETGMLPPTVNLDNPDPECDLDYIPHVARRQRISTAMANGFGFGGQNAVAVFKKFEE
ncbi:MAG: beta-ketoacyl-ACP synthase II [Chloroflexi bacterium]|nr:beta-ketoacyl-ACP synthase II [Chloroflexota bacterium]